MSSSVTDQHGKFNGTGGLIELASWLVGRDERNGRVEKVVVKRARKEIPKRNKE
jgi:hypothetical protein